MTPAHSMITTVNRGAQIGLSLLEVLIALLVLSIGLVGAAALTINSLTNVHSALHTSLASTVALDLEERLWLAAVESASNGCPSSAEIQSVVTETREQWEWTIEKERLNLPGLMIVTGTPALGIGNRTISIPVTLSWDERRLGGADREVFSYIVTTLCKRSS